MPDKKAAVVLAAGKGKRMKSDLPKVLHTVHGEPMITRIVKMLMTLEFDKIIVVVGFKGELVEEELRQFPVEIVWQKEQLGTGHAVMMAKENLAEFEGHTLIALGDVPFLKASTIDELMAVLSTTEAKASCLTSILDDPSGYGRIVRDENNEFMKEIVEHKDASEDTLKINEINTGTFCFDNKLLFEALESINNNNAQGEYYLTDCVKFMFDRNLKVAPIVAQNPVEGMGVNSIEQLEELEAKFQ